MNPILNLDICDCVAIYYCKMRHAITSVVQIISVLDDQLKGKGI